MSDSLPFEIIDVSSKNTGRYIGLSVTEHYVRLTTVALEALTVHDSDYIGIGKDQDGLLFLHAEKEVGGCNLAPVAKINGSLGSTRSAFVGAIGNGHYRIETDPVYSSDGLRAYRIHKKEN